jgi:hypothetical protein
MVWMCRAVEMDDMMRWLDKRVWGGSILVLKIDYRTHKWKKHEYENPPKLKLISLPDFHKKIYSCPDGKYTNNNK